ncbi:MAG: PIG-L deacetylase family protein [Deltaproteobacteria bacterium]
MKRAVLILSPHPDDMEIGMGGTVAKLIGGGAQVISVVVTDGRRSTSISGVIGDELARVRRAEAQEAARILAVSSIIFFELSDVKTEYNQALMREKFDAALRQFAPSEIFLPHPTIDKHPTHQATSALALEVLGGRPPLPRRIWAYEVWTPFPHYDRIEDISDVIDIKCESINAHASQIEYKSYTEGMKGLNRYRAAFDATSGVTRMKYAEVFISISTGEIHEKDPAF